MFAATRAGMSRSPVSLLTSHRPQVETGCSYPPASPKSVPKRLDAGSRGALESRSRPQILQWRTGLAMCGPVCHHIGPTNVYWR